MFTITVKCETEEIRDEVLGMLEDIVDMALPFDTKDQLMWEWHGRLLLGTSPWTPAPTPDHKGGDYSL
jgi:hypothetical protein